MTCIHGARRNMHHSGLEAEIARRSKQGSRLAMPASDVVVVVEAACIDTALATWTYLQG